MQNAPAIFFAIGLLCFCPSAMLRAELLSQALLSFPASTKSLEYDNLAQLRRLPSYETLRRQYSGESLDRVKTTFSKLGIAEESMQEVVSAFGSSSEKLYGIVSGAFSGLQASQPGATPGMRRVAIGNRRAQCSSAGVCVIFLEDSLAAFGGADVLAEMLRVREGTSPRLGAKTQLGELLAKADFRAPVIGAAPGSDLAAWIGDGIPKGLLSDANLARLLENISVFEYSVKLGRKAHLNLNLECASTQTAIAVRESLRAVNALQSVAGNFSSGNAPPPFENLTVGSSEKVVNLALDAAIQ